MAGLTDEQMAALEQAHGAHDTGGGLTDAQMAALEAHHADAPAPSHDMQDVADPSHYNPLIQAARFATLGPMALLNPVAVAKGAQNTATLGYAPQIAGAASAGTDQALQGLAKLGIGPYKNMPEGAQMPTVKESYLQGRDQRLDDDASSAARNPMSHGAGMAAGAMATAPLTSVNAIKGGGALANIGNAVLSGAAQGAAYNPGDTRGELAPVQAGDRAVHAAVGGGAAGLTAGAAEGLQGVLGRAKSLFRESARLQPNQAQEYLKDPKGIQDMANRLESQSPDDLIQKGQEAAGAAKTTLQRLLGAGKDQKAQLMQDIAGKSVTIRPAEWQGSHAELDKYLASQANQYGQLAQEVAVPAEIIQRAKTAMQVKGSYSPTHAFDPVGKAQAEEWGNRASQLRAKLEELAPSVKPINDQLQQNTILAKDIRGMLRDPLAATKTASESKLLKMALADKAAGQPQGGLYDYTSRRGAAAAISQTDQGSAGGIMPSFWRAATKHGLRASDAALKQSEALSSGVKGAAPTLTELLQELSRKK